jgi:acyl-CoA thioester hydrolase
MLKIYHHQFTVPEEVVDGNGHVNNVAYVQWMQDVAILHSDTQGCNNDLYQKLGTTWVARSHYIEYRSPAFAGDQIEILTWVSDLKRSSSLRKYKFVRTSDQKVLAQAETRWVYVSAKTGRPCTIHDEVMNAFAIVPVDEEP